MPVTGAHVLIYTPEAEALRKTFRDVFGWTHVDAGDGWLIFALPPAELAAHPSENVRHELSLICDDIGTTVAELRAKGIDVAGEPEDMRFGTGVTMRLPGGVEVLLYEPRHATAI
jgi:hypothetical protein